MTDYESSALEILPRHYALVAAMTQALEQCKTVQEGVSPEVVAFFESAIAEQVEWLASHGILISGQVMGQ